MLEAAALWFVGAGLVAFLLASAWSPLETLAWWAGHRDRYDAPLPSAPASPAGIDHFVVYLGGIDTIDGERHSEGETRFLDGLEASLRKQILVRTVFPYAASGEPLLRAPRLFLWLWRELAKTPGRKPPLLHDLINLRNLFQVLVSADRRYGPIFNAALSNIILTALAAAGWRTGKNVTLIGYSGGAQLALGAAPYLKQVLGAQLRIISIGGTILAVRGIDAVTHLDHLVARADMKS